MNKNNNNNNYNPFLNTFYEDLIKIQATTPNTNLIGETNRVIKEVKVKKKTLNPRVKGVKRNG